MKMITPKSENSDSERKRLLARVHESIEAYCRAEHQFHFDPNQPVVRLHEPTFGAEEIQAALEVLLSTKVTMGPRVLGFEREFASTFGFGHGVMNNSGSSANLLAIAALANPATKDGLRVGDEVIIPALSWSTTVWPLIQLGLVPVIVDIDPATLNLDPNEVERALGPKTRGIMPVHVYGNPCDMDALGGICERRELILIEDCCEALGAFYDGKPVGNFGRVGTFSFYFSHHMTTLEGGICVTDDDDLAELLRILRAHGWIRELKDPEPYKRRNPDIDPRFLFVNIGYNLRATEVQGAIGSVQLPKLSGFVEARRTNTERWRSAFARWSAHIDLQQETLKGRSSCFGFPITVKDEAPFSVQELGDFLNLAQIETRPIICGNIALQPAMKMYLHRTVGDLRHATRVMRAGMSFGNHQAVDAAACDYVTASVAEFLRHRGLD